MAALSSVAKQLFFSSAVLWAISKNQFETWEQNKCLNSVLQNTNQNKHIKKNHSLHDPLL